MSLKTQRNTAILIKIANYRKSTPIISLYKNIQITEKQIVTTQQRRTKLYKKSYPLPYISSTHPIRE